MYVIATVICPNFHFSVSPHVPFLNLLFEQIANSNEYLLVKIGDGRRYSRERAPRSLVNVIQYYSFVSLGGGFGGGFGWDHGRRAKPPGTARITRGCGGNAEPGSPRARRAAAEAVAPNLPLH